MTGFLSHFAATPKSVGAFVLAALAMLVSFKVLPLAQAEALGAVVTAFLALLKPARNPE